MFRKMFRYLGMSMIQNILIVFCIILVINGSALAADRNIIIGFHQSDVPSEEKLVHDNGGKVKKTFRLISAVSANMSDENITKLKKDPKVAYVETDSVYKISDEYTNSWGVSHIGSQPVHSSGITGTGVKIAVLDTGIVSTHQDLKNNYVDGIDIYNNDSNPWDDNCIAYLSPCHGTHVSGTIAAELNGLGVVGVAPNAGIYAVKVAHADGSSRTSYIISGIEWAMTNNMNIISISMSCTPGPLDPCASIALNDSINNAYNSGILIVAAGGNTKGATVTYPAVYPNVVAVTATDSNDQRASFSPIDAKIELAAPGVNINSTDCAVVQASTCISDGYGILSGTSMAAPHVTGVAALVMSSPNFSDVNGDGKADGKDVRMILDSTARDLGTTGRDDIYGYGIVDAANAIIGMIPPVPASPPSIINSEPTSPVNNIAGETRTFNITTDQTVSVEWFINGSHVQTDTSVTFAQYTNTSAFPGNWNVTAIASNVNGTTMFSWVWNVTSVPIPVPASPPKIINSFPTSPVNNVAGESRKFNITVDQIVNVTWYINNTPVQYDESITYAQYTNISASSGIWNVTAIASNINGGVMRSWTWNVTPIPPPKPALPPSITSYEPSSPVKDISGASRTFKIKIDQIVSVTWYINGTPVQSNGGVKDARYTNISALPGTWNVSAIATNVNGNVMRSWTWNVTPIPPPKPALPPSITSYEPSSPVKDIAGASRAFKIKIDQIVSVTWYLNGTPVQSDGGVKEARYTNISASPGTWNVSAIATNANGNVMRSWTWNVAPIPPSVSTINLILKRTNVSPTGDMQKVNLSKGKYSISIHNVNLTEVDIKVYENGLLKNSPSRDFKFDKERKDIDFDLTVNNVLVTFIPYGETGAIGYLTIKGG